MRKFDGQRAGNCAVAVFTEPVHHGVVGARNKQITHKLCAAHIVRNCCNAAFHVKHTAVAGRRRIMSQVQVQFGKRQWIFRLRTEVFGSKGIGDYFLRTQKFPVVDKVDNFGHDFGNVGHHGCTPHAVQR